jgi:DNA-binding transcriptional ArsR family regulator
VRKVRVILAERALPFEFIEESAWNADTTVPRYNPLNKVPALVLDDGNVVTENVAILDLLAERSEAGVTEIADAIGVHKSTASRLLASLEAGRLVEQTTHRGSFRLGFGLMRLAAPVSGRMDVTREGLPVLEALARDVVVIASDIPANREVLGPAQVCADEAGAIALVEAVLRDGAVRERLLAEQRSRRSRWSADQMLTGWTAAYERALASNPVRARTIDGG